MFGEARKQPVGLGDLLLWYGLVDDGFCSSMTAHCWQRGVSVDRISSRQRIRR